MLEPEGGAAGRGKRGGKMTTDELYVKTWKWWLSELKAIKARLTKEEEQRQTRARRKAEKLLGEYRTYQDAQDAYGCGMISERQFDRIITLLEDANPKESELYRAKVELLQEFYQEQKKILEEHGEAV